MGIKDIYKKFLNRNKSMQYQYFWLFTVVSVALVLIFGSASYQYFFSVLEKNLISHSDSVMLQLKSSQEILLSDVEMSVSSIMLNREFRDFPAWYSSRDIDKMQAASYSISRIMAENAHISSLNVYFPKYGYIYSSNQGYVPLTDFFDTDFIESLNINGQIDTTTKIRDLSVNLSDSPVPVITFVKTIQNLDSDDLVFIVNVNLSSVYINPIETYISQYDAALFIKNNLTGQKNQLNDSDLYDISGFFERIEQVNFNNNSYIGDINGVNSIVGRMNSNKYDWTYYYAIPHKKISENLASATVIFILLCITLLIVGVILSYFASKKAYQPIKNVLEVISDGMVENENEVTTITKRFIDVVDEKQSLQGLLEQHRSHISNLFILRMLFEGIPVTEKDLIANELNLNINADFAVFVAEIQNIEVFLATYSNQQQDMLYIYAKQTVEDLLVNEKRKGFAVNVNNNRLCVVANFPKDSNAEYYEFSKKLLDVVCRLSKNKFIVGVSLLHKKIENLSVAYTQAIDSLKYKVIYDKGIILYEKINNKKTPFFEYPVVLEKEINEAIRLNDAERLASLIDDFTEYFYINLPDDISIIKSSFVRLFVSIVQELYKNNMDEFTQTEGISNVFRNLNNADTIVEMLELVNSFLGDIVVAGKYVIDEKNKEIMEKIKDYILDNPSEDLTLETLSGQFYLSTSYLRRLFKDFYNMPIKKYIFNVRMQKARELLENPNVKIQEIAIKTGYYTTQSFATAFKMHHGLTPTEYRSKNSK